MKLRKKIILIGTEEDIIFELENANYELTGYFGNKKKHPLKYLGNINQISKYLKKNTKVKICIAMGPLNIRKMLLKKYKKNILTYVSKNSIISKLAKVSLGSFVQNSCFIGNYSKIGKACKINVGTNIHHNSLIGSFTDIAPSSTILGNVKIGNYCYIGSGTIVREKVKILNNIMTGIKSAVVKNLIKDGLYIGVPAKRVKSYYERP
jgi:UDP-3-O-[3-hydroxymyristoyl] glucosamine N-acyltransferase